MSSLNKLKESILADGIIDADEVKKIEETIYADGKIDKEEAIFLFELNNGVSGKDNDASWEKLFVKAISSFVLDDENSENEIDADEAEFLYQQIKGDGQIDAVERALLTNLQAKVGELPAQLKQLL